MKKYEERLLCASDSQMLKVPYYHNTGTHPPCKSHKRTHFGTPACLHSHVQVSCVFLLQRQKEGAWIYCISFVTIKLSTLAPCILSLLPVSIWALQPTDTLWKSLSLFTVSAPLNAYPL
ncbi:hypothetical protein AMECASPLE_024916 [Ameca splendens]|uniref:Uncharacterized protein n=1 Tax=Ameca splendens TaxID=208324 RepID=A0ABV0YG74_9TELE